MSATLYDGNGNIIDVGSEGGIYTEPITLTVGANGNYRTLNAALEAITEKYPVYKQGGISVQIRILSGTTIHEQIAIQKADFSYVTIVSDDEFVPVDVDGFNAQGLDSHDLRTPNVGALIGGENGAGLPCIGCLFKVSTNTNNISVVGYFANRSSKGVVLANSGFDGFNDGVISNNESSVTIREGIARNMTRWGVHARHNGEVSARSAVLTGCDIAAYADRVANLDVREADCSNSKVAVRAENSSMICAAGTHCTNGGANGSGSIVISKSGSTITCDGMEIINPDCHDIFQVSFGGTITANLLSNFRNENKNGRFNVSRNQVNQSGIIFANSDYVSHTITVLATPSDATITLKKGSTVIAHDTDAENVYTVLDDTYNLSVSKEGYNTFTQSITLSADQSITAELTPTTDV